MLYNSSSSHCSSAGQRTLGAGPEVRQPGDWLRLATWEMVKGANLRESFVRLGTEL